MEKKQLQATLQELRDALTGAEPIDDQTRELLQSVTEQLQRLLQQEKGLSQEDVHPVNRDLKELLLRFETEHPQLTSILGRIADGLEHVTGRAGRRVEVRRERASAATAAPTARAASTPAEGRGAV